jgi:pyruvate dehydrogenase E1 component beta subunit
MNNPKTYKNSLTDAMNDIAKIDNSFFIGQGVLEGGHGISPTLEQINNKKKIELPVFEELQTGIALGMAMNDCFVVSIYPRFDFFILGLNQLVNHADKMIEMSNGNFTPNIIFRVAVGAKIPLDAGPQHTQNHSTALRAMLSRAKVIELDKSSNPYLEYKKAIQEKGIFVIVEHYDLYGEIL